MKICITSLGSDLNSPIDPRFGRAQYFLFLDEKGDLEEVSSNSGVLARGGAGITAAQQIVNQGVGVLITGNVGPNAVGVLGTSKVKIFLCPISIKAKEAFLMWKENKLSQIKEPSVLGHFGQGSLGGQRGSGQGPRGRGGFNRGRGGKR